MGDGIIILPLLEIQSAKFGPPLKICYWMRLSFRCLRGCNRPFRLRIVQGIAMPRKYSRNVYAWYHDVIMAIDCTPDVDDITKFMVEVKAERRLGERWLLVVPRLVALESLMGKDDLRLPQSGELECAFCHIVSSKCFKCRMRSPSCRYTC